MSSPGHQHPDAQRSRQSPSATRPAATAGGERMFYCRACNLTTRALNVPAGWYLLERAPGGRGRHLRLGMYCSLACLMTAADELRAGEHEHAGRLGLPADPDRDRDRLLERADTMLTAGMTLPQIADTLGVSSGALRTWRRATGHPSSVPATADQNIAAAAPSPISVLHQMRDRGAITGLSITVTDADGPDHQRTFTATASASTPGRGGAREVTALGAGSGKAAARTAAAAALLHLLTATP